MKKQLLNIAQRSPGGRFILSVAVATILVCSLFSPNTVNAQEKSQKQKAQVEWYTDLADARKIANKEGKALFLFFTGSDWCGPCAALKKGVLETPEFSAWSKGNVVMVEVDRPMRKKLPATLEKQNAHLAEIMRVNSYPRAYLLTPEGGLYGRLEYTQKSVDGYIRQAEELLNSRPKGNYNIDGRPAVASEVKPRKKGVYLIWRVGSAYDPDEVPQNLISGEMVSLIEDLGMEVELQAFPAKGFEKIYLEALGNGQQPDLISSNNASIFDKLEALAEFEQDAITINRVYIRRFTPFYLVNPFCILSRSSIHYETSLKLAQSASGQGSGEITDNEVKGAEYDAMTERALSAYVNKDTDTMKELSSKHWLGNFDSLPPHLTYEAQTVQRFKHEEKGPFLISYGNIGYVAKDENDRIKDVGTRYGLVVYIREDNEWKIVTANTHPSNLARSGAYSPFDKVEDIHAPGEDANSELKPAARLTMDPRGLVLYWDQSSSPDLAYEILEVVDPSYSDSSLTFIETNKQRQMIFILPKAMKRPSGDGWRVWSVDTSGNVTFGKPYFKERE